MTYENYVTFAKQWESNSTGAHLNAYARKIGNEIAKVKSGEQTITQFAAAVDELPEGTYGTGTNVNPKGEASALNYIRDRIIHYYPD
tara:strand:- start:1327 stop:1587 length:261 start_codon:yes stop_codon:yes gene_type:complete